MTEKNIHVEQHRLPALRSKMRIRRCNLRVTSLSRSRHCHPTIELFCITRSPQLPPSLPLFQSAGGRRLGTCSSNVEGMTNTAKMRKSLREQYVRHGAAPFLSLPLLTCMSIGPPTGLSMRCLAPATTTATPPRAPLTSPPAALCNCCCCCASCSCRCLTSCCCCC